MAETELTFSEYDIFVFANQSEKAASGSAQQNSQGYPECFELPDDQGWGRGGRPVINVSWDCANEYIAWLNEQLGLNEKQGYRLPSETEWEHAIRANVKPQTDYYWDDGKAETTEYPGDFAWFSDNSENMTHPVREKKPNKYGLYDMSGNVWEWVKDCYEQDYKNTPTDGSAWNPQECKEGRVLRGGSWFDRRALLRSAARGIFHRVGNYNIGFRLAQD